MRIRRWILLSFIFIVLAGIYSLKRKHPPRQVNHQVSKTNPTYVVRKYTKSLKPVALQPTTTSRFESIPLSPKINLDLKWLLKNNPELARLNPDIDFSTITSHDPRFAHIKIPKNSKLMVLKDPKCSAATLQNLGNSEDNPLTNAIDSSDHASFINVSTDDTQTISELSEKIQSNSCALKLSANGSIDSVRLPQDTKDVSALLPPGTKDIPQVYEFKSLLKQGAQILSQNYLQGAENPAVQVYAVGQNFEKLGLPTNLDPTQVGKVSSNSLPDNLVNVFMLPMPQTDSSEQIASVNNGIIYAVDSGAHMIFVPLIDPNVIAPATQYATEHGAQIVLVPRDPPAETRTPASQ